MDLPHHCGPVAISLLNLAIGVGFVVQGQLGDRLPASLSIAMTTIGGMTSVFVLWGLATNEATLYAFAISWGLTGASFPASWVASVNDMRRTSPGLDTTLVITAMNFTKGLGSIVSGPIATALMSATPWTDLGFAYGTEYGLLIMFTGVGVTFGGAGCVARLFIRSRRDVMSHN